MKKRIMVLAVFLLLIFTMAGCGKNKDITRTIGTVDDLAGSKIGVQLGTVADIYASDYEGDKAGTTVERYNKTADAIQALRQGKIDCVIVDEQPALAYTKDEGQLSILKESFAVEDYAICIAKDNEKLLDQVNTALEQLNQNGTISQIIDNYIGDGTKGTCKYESPSDINYENGELVVATNATFPPYEFYENGQPVGIDMDIVRAIGDYLNMKVVIEDMEFDSIINAVNSSKADLGIAGMTMTEERMKAINFSNPYTKSNQVIIVNNHTGAAVSNGIIENFKRNFVTDARWKYIIKGLGNTIIIAVTAIVLGLVLGFLVSIVRCVYDKNGSLKVLNLICRIYLTIVRGTPVMIQLLIIYYVIFQAVNINKILVAIIAFGINSGAYIAEIMRGGIMSIDDGQMEAGRSLGFSYRQTMIGIILPQAIKNVLPSLANEFIALIKETSICGYIGLIDLTRGGDVIRSITYEAFLPLIVVAIIYLILVELLTLTVGKMERGLSNNG